MKKEIPVLQGKKYEMTIDRLGSSAEGVGRIQDFTVFVPYALPGETVDHGKFILDPRQHVGLVRHARRIGLLCVGELRMPAGELEKL